MTHPLISGLQALQARVSPREATEPRLRVPQESHAVDPETALIRSFLQIRNRPCGMLSTVRVEEVDSFLGTLFRGTKPDRPKG